jgi:hypothetical protein
MLEKRAVYRNSDGFGAVRVFDATDGAHTDIVADNFKSEDGH